MKELVKKDWEYTLLENENGDLVLSVLVGTILMLDFDIILTPKEKEAYEKEGIAFLDKLAADVQSYPDRYDFRTLK